MKRIVIGAAVILAGAVGLVLIIASGRPDSFTVRRSLVIHAAPGRIAPYIVDFRRWMSWSPYEKYDPAMKRIFSGSTSGRGAVYEWKGNGDIGAGRMEIVDVAPSGVSIRLDFFEPFEAHNLAAFVFEPEGAATNLTWEMNGRNNLAAKIVHVFIDMDRMVGGDFEAGLWNLKALAEK